MHPAPPFSRRCDKNIDKDAGKDAGKGAGRVTRLAADG